MSADIFKLLNDRQREAVEITKGPSVVLAGAGSGKTRVLIVKVLNLVMNHDVLPESIVMITFTNKAAREMKERIEQALPEIENFRLGFVGTFHAFCCMVLRRDGHHIGLERTFTIYNTDDQISLIKKILKKKNKTKLTPSYFLNKISDAKNQLVDTDRYLEIFAFYRAAEVADVYYEYQKELEKNMAVDFDDLIMKVVQLFTKHPPVLEKYQNRYKHLLVDEFQDTNFAQYVLTRLLAKKHQNVTAVGDFSQSIYSWRGADIRNLEKFIQDFPGAKTVYLEQNYRSTQTILDYAYDIISKNETHPILQLFTANEKGDEIEMHEAENEQSEALYVISQIEQLSAKPTFSYADCAVLYRTNAQSRALEEAFLHYGIPYTLIGGVRFYERKEIKDILSYLRLFVNPNDEISTDRIKKLGKRRWTNFVSFYQQNPQLHTELATADLIDRIFAATGYLDLYNPEIVEDYSRLENIKELKSVAVAFPEVVAFLEQVALVESEYSEDEKSGKSKEGVRLMTLHQAKGLEFPYVFIVGMEEGILPHSRSIDDVYQLEEERRLLYVGITRAMKKLFLSFARRRFTFGRRMEGIKSRFIRSPDEEEIEYYSY
jgi:DNA helicase-2/ATP-dependent DNA helicase PcrA